MNKATNPNCIHCSTVGFFQLIYFVLELGPLWSRNARENRLDR